MKPDLAAKLGQQPSSLNSRLPSPNPHPCPREGTGEESEYGGCQSEVGLLIGSSGSRDVTGHISHVRAEEGK